MNDHLSILIELLRQHPDSLSYRDLESFKKISTYIVENSSIVLIELVKLQDAMLLSQRFIKLLQWISGLDSRIASNALAISPCFSPIKIGIPLNEISDCEAPIKNLLTKFALSPTENIESTEEFDTASKVISQITQKFRNDPRFKKQFDDSSWGWS